MDLQLTASATRRLDGVNPAILIVNPNLAARGWIEATVSSAGLPAQSFESVAEMLPLVESGSATCVILDVSMSDVSVFDLQDELIRAGVAVMYVTREHCISSCVRAIKAGAVDFLTMPCDSGELVRAVGHAVRQAMSSWSRRERLHELHSRYERLTPRERQVFELVSSGLLNKQVAQQLDISEVTVQIHRGRVMRKMCARSFATLIRMADALPSRPARGAH